MPRLKIFLSVLFFSAHLFAGVEVGLDQLFDPPYVLNIKDKKVGLITNQSAINKEGSDALTLLKKNEKKYNYELIALFAPEHGYEANLPAEAFIKDDEKDGLAVFSLHGDTKRPTQKMLKDIDVLVYDIQNVGSRCYTYETTLFYAMEEAQKYGITVVVLDRPNPNGGLLVEGPMLEDKFRCFLGYNNVPFCHGMTIGELALYFNEDRKVGCDLRIIPLRGWQRDMHFEDTLLTWKAPSPNIPDAETTLVYPATIFLGESLEIVSIDRNGDKPFKQIGAPWISSDEFSVLLNQRNLAGVIFCPVSFVPKWGKFKGEYCEGVYLKVTDASIFHPLETQYAMIEELNHLYPDEFNRELEKAVKKGRGKTLNYISGSEDLFNQLNQKNTLTSSMKSLEKVQIKEFLKKREKFLLY